MLPDCLGYPAPTCGMPGSAQAIFRASSRPSHPAPAFKTLLILVRLMQPSAERTPPSVGDLWPLLIINALKRGCELLWGPGIKLLDPNHPESNQFDVSKVAVVYVRSAGVLLYVGGACAVMWCGVVAVVYVRSVSVLDCPGVCEQCRCVDSKDN